MLRWHEHQNFTRERFAALFNRLAAYMYLSFFLGLISRVLGVKPTKLSVSGLEFSVDNSNAIPGFFFAVTIALTLIILIYGVFFVFHIDFHDYSILRIFIYRIATSKKRVNGKVIFVRSLKRRDPIILKKVVLLFYRLYVAFQASIFLFPSLFAVCFEGGAVVSALKMMFR